MNPRHPYPHSHPTPYPLQSGVPQQAGTPQPYPPPHQPQPWPHHPQAQFQQGWQAPAQHGGWHAHAPTNAAPHAPKVIANGVPGDERNAGIIAHLGACLVPVVVALVLLLIANNKPFQRAVALQAAALQLGAVVLSSLVGAAAVMLLPLLPPPDAMSAVWYSFLPTFAQVLVAGPAFILTLVGAAKANNGEVLYVPLVGKLIARVAK